ncbi:MAG: putative metalloprotease [Gammaproteobacteria bacterium]|jgi:predicted metalloprotease
MRWRGGRRSENVEDRRGQGVVRGRGRAGSMLPLVMKLTRTKAGMVVLVLGAIFMWYSGIDLGSLAGGSLPVSGGTSRGAVKETAAEREMVEFVAVVLAETEDTWRTLLAADGHTYVEPKLVLFRGATKSACGLGQAAMGPFYCPADQQVYIDLSFFEDLKNKHQAPGDFAQAYVLAHEVGHHVQTLLGISRRNHAARQRASEQVSNQLSVRQELQADCFAGLWAKHANQARQILESGDLEEALAAATAIGDDRLQQQGRGYVTPDSFTHGSSKQRAHWFRTGFRKGTLAACDTFSARSL